MKSSKIKAQSQSEGHMTSTFMWYFLKKKYSKTSLSNTDCLIWYVVVYITCYITLIA